MSDFQHRHYVRIAAMIAKIKDDDTRHELTADFTNMFIEDNGRFDPIRFIAAANGVPVNGRDKPRKAA